MFRDLSTYRFSCLFSLQNTRISGLLSIQLFYICIVDLWLYIHVSDLSQAELYLLEVDTTVLLSLHVAVIVLSV